MSRERIAYSQVLRVRLPAGVSEAVSRAAADDLTSVSEFARRALVEHLRESGVSLSASSDDGRRRTPSREEVRA
jgi:hypothetical protein